MPRRYQRNPSSRKYGNSEENIEAALRDLAAGKSQRDVAKKYNICRGTLQNKAAGKHKLKPGRQVVLTPVEETTIVDHVEKIAQWGFPLDKTGWLCRPSPYYYLSNLFALHTL